MIEKLHRVVRVTSLAVVAIRLGRGLAARPAVARADPRGETRIGEVTVVVPARNEAARIGPLLAALEDAPGVAAVIVVDDGSSDATAAVAARSGCRVLAPGAPPVGWTGKSWALVHGVEAATTDWVVTIDADVRPDPALPSSVAARAVGDRIDLLTVAGRSALPDGPARWLHAAMLTQLVYRFGPPGTNRKLANGQCMAARRTTLLAGLPEVRHHLVEDVALARHLAAKGCRVDFLDATELMHVRPYESVTEVWSNWGRSIGLPGVDPWWRQAAEAVLLAAALPLPLLRLATRRADRIDALALVLRLGTLAGTRRAYADRGVAYWSSPLADPIAFVAAVTGVVRRRPLWRGRRVERPSRRAAVAMWRPTGVMTASETALRG